jgi:hypothetical protein
MPRQVYHNVTPDGYKQIDLNFCGLGFTIWEGSFRKSAPHKIQEGHDILHHVASLVLLAEHVSQVV